MVKALAKPKGITVGTNNLAGMDRNEMLQQASELGNVMEKVGKVAQYAPHPAVKGAGVAAEYVGKTLKHADKLAKKKETPVLQDGAEVSAENKVAKKSKNMFMPG